MELHHIEPKGEGGNGSFDNCIPLCFDCHADVGAYNSKHPKGRKFTVTELKQHRDDWYAKIQDTGVSNNSEQHLEIDRETFRIIREMLPSRSLIQLLRTHDFAGEFEYKQLQGLDEYKHFAEFPECEFLDSLMESLRAALTEAIHRFSSVYIQSVFTNPSSGWGGVPSDWQYKDGGKFKNLFLDATEQLNETSTEICKAYDELVKQGRRTLSVS